MRLNCKRKTCVEDVFFLVLVIYILQYDLYYKMKLSRLENCELCAQNILDVSKASSEYSVIRQCYDKPADVTEAFGQYSEKRKCMN